MFRSIPSIDQLPPCGQSRLCRCCIEMSRYLRPHNTFDFFQMSWNVLLQASLECQWVNILKTRAFIPRTEIQTFFFPHRPKFWSCNFFLPLTRRGFADTRADSLMICDWTSSGSLTWDFQLTFCSGLHLTGCRIGGIRCRLPHPNLDCN